MKELKNGAKGTDVEKLQEMLNKTGAKPQLKTDGKFGKLTEKALKKFQARKKLDVTGISDAASLYMLKLGPKPKTEDRAPAKLLDKIKKNLAGLDEFISLSKDTPRMVQEMSKFLQKGERGVAARRKDANSTLTSFRLFFSELSALRAEYDKVKTTQLARAAAILHRIEEIEKEYERLKDDFNKREKAFDGDAERLAKMMNAYDKG